MKKFSKLSNLVSNIKNSQKETTKAIAYSEGYLDCIKDLLNGNANDLIRIIEVKYDGKVRAEVYSEILPTLEQLEKEEKEEKSDVQTSTVVLESVVSEAEAMHPSDRARSFLERIGRG
jgi:hypothetical protein